jgi:subtilisin family serine protease
MRGARPNPLAARVIAAVAALAAGTALQPAASAQAADTVRDRSWHLAQMRVADAHRVTQGEGVTVAVVDSGVDASHSDLTGNVLPGIDVLDSANRNRGQRDVTGHGTAIASLIAGHGHGPSGRDGVLGIAPKARILPVSVFDAKTQKTAPDAIGQGIRLAVDRGADVICVAAGGSFALSQADAVRYARERNVLVVASVGNPPDVLVAAPANIEQVVAVTGVDRAGKTITTVRGDIDIAAPGGDIMSARPSGRYDVATGTSNSTAIVAGALALIRARYSKADRNEQLRRLVWTTTDVGEPGKDTVYGWGSLNLVDALTVEPREPAGMAAPPSRGSAQATRAAPAPQQDTGGRAMLVTLVGGVLFLAVVGVAVLVFLRTRRRRVQQAGATVDAPAVD